MRTIRLAIAFAAIALTSACKSSSDDDDGGAPVDGDSVGDTPALQEHLDQEDIESGELTLEEILSHGEAVFAASFNTLDGASRPETTGTGNPRSRREGVEKNNRISAPDADSCAGCHNMPRIGGGGDNVANVFVLGQRLPFVNFDGAEGDEFQDHTLDNVANERNTLGMFGAGFVELLAREMTADLHAIRDQAIADANDTGSDVTQPLTTKGVDFGSITARPDGSVDTSAVDGVDADLVIKPFHQKGAVTSLRQFSNNAFNHHHGIQTTERFGDGVDADNDSYTNELSVGDVTATTLFQATLPVPGRVLPTSDAAQAAVRRGEELFDTIGCAVCHIPELVLENPLFTEPNPYNPDGNLKPEDVSQVVGVDLTEAGPGPHLRPQADGSVRVPLFSDLKRHDMGPGLCDNEKLEQDGIPTGDFITRKLWGFASEPPFLHHGRVTLISESIVAHGGDAEASRLQYEGLSVEDQQNIVEYLKTLRILPEDATDLVLYENGSGIIGDEPAVIFHMSQNDIEQDLVSLDELIQHGKNVFEASFNELDGQGRPETTGTGGPRARREGLERFNRISAPDANACSGCHNLPRTGGGGDNVANVFVMAQRLPFVNFDGLEGDGNEDQTLKGVGNERNTLGMFGAGYIELLAREMTADLQALRDDAISQAQSSGSDVRVELLTKGVSFGALTARPDGSTNDSEIDGVDHDLIIKPFHQKGAVISLRQFSNNAFNHHHGMQTAERFGDGVDADNDSHTNELTAGDVTAITIFQATLPVPGRVLPADPERRQVVDRGEELFDMVGCTDCHIPALRLNNPVFTEPNLYNPDGNLKPEDVTQTFAVDLPSQAQTPRLPRESDGSVLVPAFTDLKRHDLGDELDNELLVQDGIPTSHWLTKKLWGMANEPPFMHHGRASLISEAILMHGGDAQSSRESFSALPEDQQDAIIEFLKTLQVHPEGTTEVDIER